MVWGLKATLHKEEGKALKGTWLTDCHRMKFISENTRKERERRREKREHPDSLPLPFLLSPSVSEPEFTSQPCHTTPCSQNSRGQEEAQRKHTQAADGFGRTVTIFKEVAVFPGGLPTWLTGKESACQDRRHRFNPWVGKIPCRGK